MDGAEVGDEEIDSLLRDVLGQKRRRDDRKYGYVTSEDEEEEKYQEDMRRKRQKREEKKAKRREEKLEREKRREEKRRKREKRKERRSRGGSADDDETMEWEEVSIGGVSAPEAAQRGECAEAVDTATGGERAAGKAVERQSWMVQNPGRSLLSGHAETERKVSEADKAAEQEKRKEAIRKERELNVANRSPEPVRMVGDGGTRWQRKREQRERQEEAEMRRSGTKLARSPLDRRSPHTESAGHQRGVPSRGDAPSGPVDKSALRRLHQLALKAKLRGDVKEHDRLRSEIERVESGDGGADDEHIVKVSGLDVNGRMIVMSTAKGDAAEEDEDGRRGRRKRKKADQYNEGERVRYFANDDKIDLEDMVREEKAGTGERYDETFAKAVVKQGSGFNAVGEDDFDNDRLLMMFEKTSKRTSQEERGAREQRAIQAQRVYDRSIDECTFCFHDNPKLEKHVVISMGDHVYLTLPPRGQMVPGHCFIVPMRHAVSSIEVENDVYREILLFQKHLYLMFRALPQPMEPVFMEMVRGLKRNRHTLIECIPMPREVGLDAPLYFKKAINECEVEWTQHRKLINTSEKGLRASVPRGFPFFHVEVGDGHHAFAHVIEDEHRFPGHFGREVVAGMLDLPPESWLRSQRQSRQEQLECRKRFLAMWQPHDWTVELDGGAYE